MCFVIDYNLHDVCERLIASNDGFSVAFLDSSLRRFQKLWEISISEGHEVLLIVQELDKLRDGVHSSPFDFQWVVGVQKAVPHSDHKAPLEGLPGTALQERFHDVSEKPYPHVSELGGLRLGALPEERHEVGPLPLGHGGLCNAADDVGGAVAEHRSGV